MSDDELKQLALRTFLRDLPDLYREKPSEWVAYRGEVLIGFGKQQHLLYQDWLGRGYRPEEFVVFCIEPLETEMWMNPQV